MFYTDGTYIRGMLRRTAAIIQAKVVSQRADGDYWCELSDTGGQVVASRGDLGVSLSPGQLVLLSRTDSSGRGVGSGYVILSYPPTSGRNSSLATGFDAESQRTGTTVSRITVDGEDAESVTLVAGGAAKAVTINGTGLSAGATYGHAGIANHVPQVLTETTRLVITVEASGATPDGTYGLTIPGYGTIPDFFIVT